MKREKSCGAVVYRIRSGEIYILVEHMALGHTSIPKGHVEPGETEEQTALREIAEETALRVRLDTGFRRTVSYSPAPGVLKECEVKSAGFLTEREAMAAMTFDSDRETIAAACDYIRARTATA